MKKMQQQTGRTLGLAAIGLAVLVAVVPEWARAGMIAFAAIYAVLVIAVDADVRRSLLPRRDSRLLGSDREVRKAAAPRPSVPRAVR